MSRPIFPKAVTKSKLESLPHKYALVVGAGVAILLAPLVRAADFRISIDPKQTCSAVEVTGEIMGGDQSKFGDAVREAARLAPLRRLYLNSRGGDFSAAVSIWQTIRKLTSPIEAVVQSGHECSSACVLLLAAAAQRFVSSSATVVVHEARNTVTNEPSRLVTMTYGYYLIESGFSKEVLRNLMDLKPAEDFLITPSNAKGFGFDRLHFFGDTNPPATPGCSWKGFLHHGE